mgnify:CR=1 FL=1
MKTSLRRLIVVTVIIIGNSSAAFQNPPPLNEPSKAGPQLVVQLGHSTRINAAAFSRDGRLVLSGGDENLAILWEVATGREIRRFVGHEAPVNSAAFSPDGRLILTGSGDATARLWNTTTAEETFAFRRPFGKYYRSSFLAGRSVNSYRRGR